MILCQNSQPKKNLEQNFPWYDKNQTESYNLNTDRSKLNKNHFRYGICPLCDNCGSEMHDIRKQLCFVEQTNQF